MMRYLVLRTSLNHPTGVGSAGSERIENLVVSSNEVFEAFGNAKTVHNENSSRFGKYLEMKFSTKKCRPFIASLQARQFSLERSRLTYSPQASAFSYSLSACRWPPNEQREALGLRGSISDYHMLCGGAPVLLLSFLRSIIYLIRRSEAWTAHRRILQADWHPRRGSYRYFAGACGSAVSRQC